MIQKIVDEQASKFRSFQIGQIVPSFLGSPFAGTLVANGGAVSRTLYADLFNLIGTQFGAGDGSTTFNLPNIPENFALLSAGTNIASIGQTLLEKLNHIP